LVSRGIMPLLRQQFTVLLIAPNTVLRLPSVVILSTVLYSVQLFFLTRLHAIVGQYRKTGWLFWIFPLVVTVFIGILIAGDNIILSDLRKEDGIVNVKAQGSFWL